MSMISVNRELCTLFGLDSAEVQAVNIKIRAGSYPTLFVRYAPRRTPSGVVADERQRFMLVALDGD